MKVIFNCIKFIPIQLNKCLRQLFAVMKMDDLKEELNSLNNSIDDLENRIEKARTEAEANVKPLNEELSQIKEDKRTYALKNDFDSIQDCRRREDNLKFKISAQWNQYTILKNELVELNKQKRELESQIKLEEDKIKRKNEILAQMDMVLDNYRKTQSLRQAAVDSKISPDHVEQWFDWGKNDFNETYSYFYTQIIEIDSHFKDMEAQKLKDDMDRVISAYRKTGSLEEASRIADVSYDTVMYWYEWGSRGFGEENVYFFKKLDSD